MRFFIALEIPKQSISDIIDIQKELKILLPQAKLTDPSKLHITIAFVGNQPSTLTDPLTALIKSSTFEVPPFTITPAYIDGFPNLHHAHVLWLGVKGDIDKLFIIQERIKDGLTKLGLNADHRRYTPHIAIAKISNFNITPEIELKLQQLSLQPHSPIHITSLKLFESIPNHNFHTHNTISEIQLLDK